MAPPNSEKSSYAAIYCWCVFSHSQLFFGMWVFWFLYPTLGTNKKHKSHSEKSSYAAKAVNVWKSHTHTHWNAWITDWDWFEKH